MRIYVNEMTRVYL